MDKKTLIISAPLIISTPISYAHASDTSISVYPPILQVKAGPGANVSAPVSIRNNGKEEVILDILFRPFASESTRIGRSGC